VKYSIKTKVGVIIGIALIVAVASLLGLPYMNEESAIQKASEKNIKKMESAEEKLLNVIEHEKSEIEHKIGGKLMMP